MNYSSPTIPLPGASPASPSFQQYGSYGQTVRGPSHDKEAFPRLGSAKPVVSLPETIPVSRNAALDVNNIAKSTDLEARMRSMILNSSQANQDLAETEDPAPDRSRLASNQPQSRRKPNQAERKQQIAESRQLLAEVHQTRAAITPKGQTHRDTGPHRIQRAQQSSRQYDPNIGTPHWRGNGIAHPQGQTSFTQAHNTASPSFRPPPQTSRLYNPDGASYGLPLRPHVSHNFPQGQHMGPTFQQQSTYLSLSIENTVKASEISSEEYEATQTLKKSLEDACRRSITDFELQHNPDFSPISVQLASFGSLATTFATRGSDMDLVILSPQSIPDASSIDSPLPRLIEKTLLDMGHGVRLLTKTRVPIIKFCEKPTPDLSHRLLEARRSWEEENDGPVAELKSKGSKRKPRRLSKVDELEPAEPKPTPSTEAELDKSSTGGPVAASHLSLQREDSSSISNSMALRSNATVVAVGDEPRIEHTLLDPRGAENQIKATPKVEDGHDLERDDPSIALKSDEERVRLYRLAMKEGWYEPHERRIIMTFIEAIENSAWESDLNATRENLKNLPNILKRYRPPHEKHLEFPKNGVGIQCDINFSNLLALHNSALLRCYSQCDPRVRPMVLFVKLWAKTRKINSAYEGTLSSYGYVLMVLHFLVNIADPPVLPNLQQFPLISEDEASSALRELEGCNIQFYRNEAKLKELAAKGELTSNQAPLHILIRAFFFYYGSSEVYGNYHWMQDCLSLRTAGGLVSKKSKGWTAAKTEVMDAGPDPKQKKDIRQRYLVAIEDPFEIHHNVGRTVSHDGIVAIRDEFRRAHRLIQNAGNGLNGQEDLLVEAERKGNVQYRYFGPRPWKKDVKPTSGNKQASEGQRNEMLGNVIGVPQASASSAPP